MQSKRKSNTVVTHEYSNVTHLLTFHVGEQKFDFDVGVAAGPEWLNLPMTGQCAIIHGFVQKISDRAAIGRDPETGASATPEEKFAAMKETAERLMAGGPWNAVATGTGNTGGILYRAMRVLYPQAWSDKVSFAAYIAEKAISESARLGKKVSESDVRNGLMAVKKIAAEINKLRAAEGVAVDAGGMLQELEG
jgi:hypothetical protein